MSTLALIAAAPLALMQSNATIAQAPLAQAPLAQAPIVQIAAQPAPGAEAAQLVQPASASHGFAADGSAIRGPAAGDPLADEIVWANALTAQRRAEAGRAGWRKIAPFEIAWQLLNVLDLAQTLSCTHRPDCSEANPILGSRPSDGLVIGVKGGMAVLHYLLMRRLAERNWKTARNAEFGTIMVQGAVDGLNFRHAFK